MNGLFKKNLIPLLLAVRRILSKSTTYKIEKADVNVRAFDPSTESLWEERRLLVTGVDPETSRDGLENFLESRGGGVVPENFMYGEDEGKVVVTFEDTPGT